MWSQSSAGVQQIERFIPPVREVPIHISLLLSTPMCCVILIHLTDVTDAAVGHVQVSLQCNQGNLVAEADDAEIALVPR